MPKWEKYLDEDADIVSFEKFTKKKKTQDETLVAAKEESAELMNKENLKIGMKVKVSQTVPDSNGALYENDVVEILDWNCVSKVDKPETYVIFVKDISDKHHTVGLEDIKPL